MKTFLQIVVACLFAQVIGAQTMNTNSPLTDSWTRKTDFGGIDRGGAVGFSIGSKGYIGTGKNFATDKYCSDFWEYDPVSDAWAQKADFGGGFRSGAAGFSIGSKGYVGTGYYVKGNGYYNDFWEYDPAGNTWTRKADVGGYYRSLALGFSIGSKGYIGTGAYGNPYSYDYFQDFWEYDPVTNKWTRKADFIGGGRVSAVGFSIENKGYIGTGLNDFGYLKDFWEYDPVTGSWTRKADFGGTARTGSSKLVINNKGYIGMGLDASPSHNKKDFWEYDPVRDYWIQKADFQGSAVYNVVGFSIGNKGYLGTGSLNSIPTSEFWEYTPGEATTAIPTITSFTPTSGPVGTTITITGINFGATPADNIVHFGATKAMVTAASTTLLTVLVPVGATYEPITVTTNGLTAYAAAPFAVTFAGDDGPFTPASFAPKIDFATTSYAPTDLLIGDLDGDGRADAVSNNMFSNSISIFRNTGSAGTVAFAPALGIPTGNKPFSPRFMADLDGDGKLDLAFAAQDDNAVNVFRNTSSLGNISLSDMKVFACGIAPADLAFGDLDGDGKTDIVTSNIDVNTFSVLRNTGNAGNIAFDAKIDFATSNSPRSALVHDMDGDGKPDVLVINIFGSNSISVFRNTGSGSTISFAPKVDIPTDGSDPYMAVGDLDGDQKPDIVVANTYGQSIAVYRNLSTPGVIAFAAKLTVATGAGSSPYDVALCDLNGDGKTDIAASDQNRNSAHVFRNTSVSGALSFDLPVEYSAGTHTTGVSMGDFDNDGKPDLALANQYTSYISILRNQAGEALCPVPTELAADNITAVSARISWVKPATLVPAIKIRYNVQGSPVVLKRLVKGTATRITLQDLLPNTTYEWKMRSACTDDKSGWVQGPAFTTSAIAVTAITADASSAEQSGASLLVSPNPNKGQFTIQAQLPDKPAATTFILYNNEGRQAWKQEAGTLNGTLRKTVSTGSALTPGVYMLVVQRKDIRLVQKIVIE